MAYLFYMAGVELPITPASLHMQINSRNKEVTLIDQGDINILKYPGLTDISFECVLPSHQYPFANSAWVPPAYFLDLFEGLKEGKQAFQFVVTRPLEDGRMQRGTSIRVALEEYEIIEDAEKDGTDVRVSIKLKQYRDYGTKTVMLSNNKGRVVDKRQTDNAPNLPTYTTQPGDTMYTVAKSQYGNGNQWKKVYEANKEVVGSNPNMPYSGKVLKIPQ